MRLSVIIPVYNEEKTILELIKRVENVQLPIDKEIIIVDDHSTDNTPNLLLNTKHKIIHHPQNGGKGAALKTGFKHATGKIILIQDADLEYDPQEYPKLIQPIIDGETKVVYGTRFGQESKGKLKNDKWSYKLHCVGNWGLTKITNMLYGCKLTDMETCYKVFTREVLTSIGDLRANRFDFEPEITAKILKNKYQIKEVPINYESRGFEEGKKITWKDGLKAATALIKYRFVN